MVKKVELEDAILAVPRMVEVTNLVEIGLMQFTIGGSGIVIHWMERLTSSQVSYYV